jgi:hypothetical protein
LGRTFLPVLTLIGFSAFAEDTMNRRIVIMM